MNKLLCPVCQSELSHGLKIWHYVCNFCKYEKAILEPVINVKAVHERIDELDREAGLKTLRVKNFNIILHKIFSIKGKSGKLLDVGCSYGWFLDLAKQDFTVLGIEPDNVVYLETQKRQLPVRNGYFPTALRENEMFDIIIFNDVFEHILDVNIILDECYKHLNKDGILVLNLPNSGGVFYGLSKLLLYFKLDAPFKRLWQEGLPSPHLHYFNLSNIKKILLNHEYKILGSGNLSSIEGAGLYERISHVQKSKKFMNTLLYILIIMLIPVIRLLPKDIIYIIAKKTDNS